MLKLSKIQEKDLELLRKWRMSEYITRYMLTDPNITVESQKKWYEQIIKRQDAYYWMIQYNDKRIGYMSLTNIDAKKKQCEAGHYIGETAYLRKGISKVVEANIYDFVFEQLNLEMLIFIMLKDNIAAQKLHLSLGALPYEPEINVCYKKDRLYELIGQYMTKEIWSRNKKIFDYPKIMIEN